MQQQSHSGRNANRKATKRRDQSARNNILSVRVSDQERHVLETITKSTCRNVSDLVREAIEFWLTKNRKRLTLEA